MNEDINRENQMDRVIIEISWKVVQELRNTKGACLLEPNFIEAIKAMTELYSARR
ncbi:hypothetical protein SAMN02745687_00947 [Lachnospiraceae bacterium NK3A20]|nr:hypothetical protein SAMN02745687_00947 [Lachnospiraceae bacterium NK3A20]